jgi:hypothetical protein
MDNSCRFIKPLNVRSRPLVLTGVGALESLWATLDGSLPSRKWGSTNWLRGSGGITRVVDFSIAKEFTLPNRTAEETIVKIMPPTFICSPT